MTENEELLSDWKAAYGELFPHREPDGMAYTDSMLALGVLLRREMRMNAPVPRVRVRYLANRYTGKSE